MCNDTFCPVCTAPIAGATHVDGHPVEAAPGDVRVCDSCGAALIYNEDVMLRYFTAADALSFPEDERELLYQVVAWMKREIAHRKGQA